MSWAVINPNNAYRLAALLYLPGHEGTATSVAFSPGESAIATGGIDGRVNIRYFLPWTGKNFSILFGHAGWVKSIAFGPSGRTLASGGNDGYLRIWELDSGRLIATIWNPSGFISGVVYSPDNRLLATAGGNTATIWEVATGRFVNSCTFAGTVTSVAFNPDGRTLAVGGCGKVDPVNNTCLEGKVSFWNLITQQTVEQVITGLEPAVTTLAFSPDGSKFAAGVVAGKILLWDFDQVSPGPKQLGSYGSAIYGLSFNSDASLLAASSLRGFVLIWDTQKGAPIDKLFTDLPEDTAEEFFTPVAFSPTGRALAIGQTDGMIVIWGTWDLEPMNTVR